MSEPKTYRFATGEFADLELVDPIPGRQKWWKKMMTEFEKADLMVVRFNSSLSQMKDGGDPELLKYAGGGYFWRRGCNFIEMPARDFLGGAVIVKGNKVMFPSDKLFACFLHECQHFMHLFHDKGLCIAPGLEGEYREDMIDQPEDFIPTDTYVRDCEYEATYRAVYYGKVYKMFPGSNINFVTQMLNLYNRDKMFSPYWTQAINEKMTSLGYDLTTPEGALASNDWVVENIISKVKSVTAWANPKHDFPGILD